MTTIGTIELIAKIDTSQYKKGTKEIESSNKEIESSADNSSKRMASSWSTGAQLATAAIVAAGAIIVRTFVNSASEIQSLRASFESLTGNVEDTNSVMTDLYELGKQTAFSNKDIQAAGRNYLAAGVSVEGLGEVLKNTADIAGATGADLGQLTLPLTQTIARGKLQTQDFYQILNSGAGALRKPLTELAGKKGFGSLADALEKSAITSDDLLKVMGDVTKEGGFAFQGAIKQSETFNGRMSNLREAITNVGLGLLGVDAVTGQIDPGGAFSKMSNAIKIATNFLVENQVIIKQVATAITVLLIPAFIMLGKMAIVAGFNIAKGMLLALGPIGLIVAAIGAATYLIMNNWQTVKTFVLGVWQSIKDALTPITEYISNIWNVVATGTTEAWNKIKTVIVNTFNTVKNTVQGVYTAVIGWLYDWRQWFINIGIVIGTVLLPSLIKIGIEAAVTAATTIASFASMAAAAVINAVKTSVAWTISAAQTAYVWITQTLPQMIIGFAKASASAVVNSLKTSAAFVAASAKTLASWTVTFARMVTGFVLIGVQALIAGAKVAAGMLLALGPIGLIIAVVAGAAALIVANWDTVKNAFIAAFNWLKDNWPLVLAIITGPIGLAILAIVKNFDKIKEAASTVFNWIKNIFGSISSIATDIFKGAINGVLSLVEKTINSYIKLLNGAINIINKLPGVNVGNISGINIPRLAQGGIVTGPTIAEIGEGGEAEAVIPLSKLDKMLSGNSQSSNNSNITVNIQGVFATSPAEQRKVAEQIVQRIREVQQSRGLTGSIA